MRSECEPGDVEATRHLVDRWCRRFRGQDLEAAFARSVRLRAVQLERFGVEVRFGQEYHRDPETGAVFVLRRSGHRWVAITVIRTRAG